jgi:hypothetical protein
MKKYFTKHDSLKDKFYVNGKYIEPFAKLLDGILGIILLPTKYSPNFNTKLLFLITKQWKNNKTKNND